MKKTESAQERAQRKKRAEIVCKELQTIYPHPKIALHYSNTLELLIAVILSAQCTDKKVNEVTEKLFKKYPNLDAYVAAKPEEFEQDIRPTGFYKAKTKNILKTARIIKDEFGGKVPDTMENLLKLSGVARKTANVVMGVAYKKPVGIIVDTHMIRLANKYHLTDESDPVKIEKDLMKILPRDKWTDFALSLVLYGREYSTARKKNDDDDPISIALLKAKCL